MGGGGDSGGLIRCPNASIQLNRHGFLKGIFDCHFWLILTALLVTICAETCPEVASVRLGLPDKFECRSCPGWFSSGIAGISSAVIGRIAGDVVLPGKPGPPHFSK